jgi:hypothetical protein
MVDIHLNIEHPALIGTGIDLVWNGSYRDGFGVTNFLDHSPVPVTILVETSAEHSNFDLVGGELEALGRGFILVVKLVQVIHERVQLIFVVPKHHIEIRGGENLACKKRSETKNTIFRRSASK